MWICDLQFKDGYYYRGLFSALLIPVPLIEALVIDDLDWVKS